MKKWQSGPSGATRAEELIDDSDLSHNKEPAQERFDYFVAASLQALIPLGHPPLEAANKAKAYAEAVIKALDDK